MRYRNNMDDDQLEEFVETIGKDTKSRDELVEILAKAGYPHCESVRAIYFRSGHDLIGAAMVLAPSGNVINVDF